MSRSLSRVLRTTLIVLLVLAVGLTAFGVYTVRRSFPQTTGTLQLEGLLAQVDVYRTGSGVPHIFAENEHDLFMAAGFVHAQDRFWQMDFWRHIGSGRLSEMFGETQLGRDRFLRTLGWARVAQQEFEKADEQTRTILLAYAEGVNAYLAQTRGADRSLEYAVLGLLNPDYEPEPWTPVHSLTWAKAMAWDLGGNLDAEIDRALLLDQVGEAGLAMLYPPYPNDKPAIVPDAGQAGGSRSSAAAALPSVLSADALRALSAEIESLQALTGGGFEGIGSNNWVVSGDRTVTGMPLLADDTHLGIQIPAIWYEIGLHCRPIGPNCRFNAVGFSFAGAPGVIIGHNDHIAWGVTNLNPDVQDLYIEKLNPENPDQYEVNGEWVDMEIIEETIRVAGGESETLTIRSTRHGPIISETYGSLEAFADEAGVELPASYAIALRWTALEPSRLYDAALRVSLATNWDEFRDALRLWDVPSQNFVYADVEGNIGYQMPGKVPIRAGGDGWLPVPGWTDEHEWMGYLPFEELPFSFNPPEGYIVTANNAVVGTSYPHLLGLDWDYGYRAARIVELIEQGSPLSVENMQTMHGDNHNAMGPVLIPVLLQVGMPNEELSDLQARLAGWNFQNHMDSGEAAIFNAFWRHLLLGTFSDELPEGPLPGSSRAFLVLEGLIEEPQHDWWDDQTTPEREDLDAIFARAFADAIAELKTLLGADSSRWMWGDLHTATFRNQSLGSSGVAPIEALFNRGPFRASGGSSIVNATGWNYARGYELTSLPSQRLIADLADFSRSLAIHTTGQSGHAFHPQYIDMADPWRNIEYEALLWTEAEIRERTVDHLILQP